MKSWLPHWDRVRGKSMLLKGHLLSGHGGGSLLILLLHLVREPPECLA